MHLGKVLEVISTSVYTGQTPFNFTRKRFLQLCLCLSAQRLSESTVVLVHSSQIGQSIISDLLDRGVGVGGVNGKYAARGERIVQVSCITQLVESS